MLDPNDTAGNDSTIRRMSTFDQLADESEDDDDEFAAFDKMLKKEVQRKEALGIAEPKIRDFSDEETDFGDQELPLLKQLAEETSGDLQPVNDPTSREPSTQHSRESLELLEFDRLMQQQAQQQPSMMFQPNVPANRPRLVLDTESTSSDNDDDSTFQTQDRVTEQNEEAQRKRSDTVGTAMRLSLPDAVTSSATDRSDARRQIESDLQTCREKIAQAKSEQRFEDVAVLTQQLGFIEEALREELGHDSRQTDTSTTDSAEASGPVSLEGSRRISRQLSDLAAKAQVELETAIRTKGNDEVERLRAQRDEAVQASERANNRVVLLEQEQARQDLRFTEMSERLAQIEQESKDAKAAAEKARQRWRGAPNNVLITQSSRSDDAQELRRVEREAQSTLNLSTTQDGFRSAISATKHNGVTSSPSSRGPMRSVSDRTQWQDESKHVTASDINDEWWIQLEHLKDRLRATELELEARVISRDSEQDAAALVVARDDLRSQLERAKTIALPSVDDINQLKASNQTAGDEVRRASTRLTGPGALEVWQSQIRQLEDQLDAVNDTLSKQPNQARAIVTTKESLEEQLRKAKSLALPSFGNLADLQKANRESAVLLRQNEKGGDRGQPRGELFVERRNKIFGEPPIQSESPGHLDQGWAISATLRMHLAPERAVASNRGVAELKQLISQAMQIQDYLRKRKSGNQKLLSVDEAKLGSPVTRTNAPIVERPDQPLAASNIVPDIDEKADINSMPMQITTESRDNEAIDWVVRTQEELQRAVNGREYGRAARLFALLQRLRGGRQLPTDVETRDEGFVHNAADPWDYVYTHINHRGRLGLGLQNTALDSDIDANDTDNDAIRLQSEYPVVITRVDSATDGFGVEGVVPGDRIVQVNGEDTKGLSFQETLRKISSSSRPLELTFLRYVAPSESGDDDADGPSASTSHSRPSSPISEEAPSTRVAQDVDTDPPAIPSRRTKPKLRVDAARRALAEATTKLSELRRQGPEAFDDNQEAFAKRITELEQRQKQLQLELDAAEKALFTQASTVDEVEFPTPNTVSHLPSTAARSSDIDDEENLGDGSAMRPQRQNHSAIASPLVASPKPLRKPLPLSARLRQFVDRLAVFERDIKIANDNNDADRVDALSGRRDQTSNEFQSVLRKTMMGQSEDELVEREVMLREHIEAEQDPGMKSALTKYQAAIKRILRDRRETEGAPSTPPPRPAQIETSVGEHSEEDDVDVSASEQRLSEVELQITAAIAANRFSEAVALGKERDRLQKHIRDGLRRDELLPQDDLEAAASALQQELDQVELDITTAVASNRFRDALELSARRDNLQTQIRRISNFATSKQSWDDTEHSLTGTSNDRGPAHERLARLRRDLATTEIELAEAQRNDQLAKALLLSQRRNRLALEFEHAEEELRASTSKDPKPASGKVTSDSVTNFSDEGLPSDDENDNTTTASISTSETVTEQQTGLPSQFDDQSADSETVRDPLVLRAAAVSLEKSIREMDLAIISAIDNDDFDQARELNAEKHDLKQQLESAQQRLSDVQSNDGNEIVQNKTIEETAIHLQQQLQDVEQQLVQAPGDAIPALKKKRAVVQAELQELRHRVVSGAAASIPSKQNEFDAGRDEGVTEPSVQSVDHSVGRWVAVAADLERQLQSIETQLAANDVPATSRTRLESRRKVLLRQLEDEYVHAIKTGELATPETVDSNTETKFSSRAPFEPLASLSPSELQHRLRAKEREIAQAVASDRFDAVQVLQQQRNVIHAALSNAMNSVTYPTDPALPAPAQVANAVQLHPSDAKAVRQLRTEVGDAIATRLAAKEQVPMSGSSVINTRNNWSSGIRLPPKERAAIELARQSHKLQTQPQRKRRSSQSRTMQLQPQRMQAPAAETKSRSQVSFAQVAQAVAMSTRRIPTKPTLRQVAVSEDQVLQRHAQRTPGPAILPINFVCRFRFVCRNLRQRRTM